MIPVGWEIGTQDPVTHGRQREPEPDLAIIRGEFEDYANRNPGPADVALVVEVADSSLARDRGFKKELYAEAGFADYWILNVVDRQLETFSDPTGPAAVPDYRTTQVFGPADEVSGHRRRKSRRAVEDCFHSPLKWLARPTRQSVSGSVMAKARGTEAKLDRLRLLRRETPTPEILVELRLSLADKSNLVVAEAAKDRRRTKARRSRRGIGRGVSAFDGRSDPESDPRCRAKIALLPRRLNQIEHDEPAVFLRGLTHARRGSRPGEDDPRRSAARHLRLRAGCRVNHRGVVIQLADLLHDSRDRRPRRCGARSPLANRVPQPQFRCSDSRPGLGDPSPEVVEACLTGLMTAAPALIRCCSSPTS